MDERQATLFDWEDLEVEVVDHQDQKWHDVWKTNQAQEMNINYEPSPPPKPAAIVPVVTGVVSTSDSQPINPT